MEYQEIYQRHAAEYDALVNAEDCEGHLLPAIEKHVSLAGASVMEVGAGTGRVSRLMAKHNIKLVGVDQAAAMLAVGRDHLSALAPKSTTTNGTRWQLAQADGRALPVRSGWADLAIAGWVFGHLRLWMLDNWQHSIGQALNEMKRSLKPNGVIIIIETLGTGSTQPAPPSDALADYYRWLENDQGFQREAIQTDYQFNSIEEAAAITGFFFGENFGERVKREAWQRVPEYTGLWSKRV